MLFALGSFLIIGGNAKIIVATTPGVKPTPNNITTGIK